MKRSKLYLLAGLYFFLISPSLLLASEMVQGLGSLIESVSKPHLSAPNHSKNNISALSHGDMVAGLKDALRVASKNVVAQVSKKNGFNGDAHIHIPLPKKMKRVKSALSAVGMGRMMTDLELKLNRAAESASPKAKRIFINAIKSMKFHDAKVILQGPNDAATQYFKRKMSGSLSKKMRPIVSQALSQAGALQVYGKVMGQYQSLPFVPNVKADLTQHVLDLALKGLFYYMAEEEAAIRKSPVKRTTRALRKVFG